MKSKNNYITDLVLEFFRNKSEVEKLFLIDYITHKSNTLLATNLIDKKDQKLADILAISAYARETKLLNQVMSVTNDQLEKEKVNC